MASAAVAVDEQSMSPPPSQAESQSPRPFYKLRAGVILSRPPQITRDLSSFEKAFYLYQRRLNERLSLPFTKYFYFQKDTPAELDFKRKLKERQTMARDIGTYAPYSPEGWNDEVKVGSAESEPSHQMEALWNDSQSTTSASGDAEEIAAAQKQSEAKQLPSPRVTDADHQNDQQSLNRALQRTLHLLVQNQASQWVFPDDGLLEKESLQTVGLSLDILRHRKLTVAIGCEANPVRRSGRQHEYVGRRQPTRWPRDDQGPWQANNRRRDEKSGKQSVFHEGAYNGGPGGSGSQQIRLQGLSLVDKGRDIPFGDAKLLEQCTKHPVAAVRTFDSCRYPRSDCTIMYTTQKQQSPQHRMRAVQTYALTRCMFSPRVQCFPSLWSDCPHSTVRVYTWFGVPCLGPALGLF